MVANAPSEPMRLLLTAREAAKLLSISEKTLSRMRLRGDLAAVLIGRAVRFDPRDLREFIETNKTSGGVAAET